MSSFLTLAIVQNALELGFVYALVALALYLSYSVLNIADLSTDGCFVLGCAVGATVALAGHPVLALFAAMGAGVVSGFVTAFLQTRLGVQSILAGIIVNTGLYTVNIAAMGFSSNLNLFTVDTLFTRFAALLRGTPLEGWGGLVLAAGITLLATLALRLFLGTRLGLSIRATGDNADMVRSSSINPAFTITVGLCISGALTALSGAVLAQYQKTCDVNLGTGMVTIALASLIIGETLLSWAGPRARMLAPVVGSVVYRFIMAIALRLNLPAECLKLVSAIIVAVAIAAPRLRQLAALQKRKMAAAGARRAHAAKGGDAGC